eukprot:131922_1
MGDLSSSNASHAITSIVLFVWIATSCIFSTYANTAFLNEFNDASALTFFRFAGSAFFGFITNILFGSLSIRQMLLNVPALFIPSLFLLSANFFNSVALNLTGISVTYITKSTIPIWTALITVLYFRHKPQTYSIYLTLIPTVIGVAMSSLSDLDFRISGFIAALVSTISQTLMNIVSRNTLQSSDLNGAQFQFVMASINTVILFPIYLYFADDTSVIYKLPFSMHNGMSWHDNREWIVFVLAPLAYHVEYVFNCLLVGRLSALAFSMTDITRRLLIIICGAIMFNKTLNCVNKCGIVLALGGVALYTKLSNKASDTHKAK